MRRLALIFCALALGACSGLGGEPPLAMTVAPLATSEGIAPPNLARGARIFAKHCTDCHGEDGAGGGALVLRGDVPVPLDMTDRALASRKSPRQWFDIITQGKLERLMPPWENALSERERWDVALYSYSLQLDDEELEAGAALWQEHCQGCALPSIAPMVSDGDFAAELQRERLPSTLSQRERLAVAAYLRMQSLQAARASSSGQVQHGSAGGVVPAGSVVQLRVGKEDTGYELFETKTDAAGRFNFDGLPSAPGDSYILAALYDGRQFSQRLPAEELQGATITVYDATAEPNVLQIARIELYVEPLRLQEWGAGYAVSQLLSLHNDSDRVFSSGRRFDDGREAVLLLPFPAGARNLGDDSSGRYVQVEASTTLPYSLIDTVPVLPGGGHQILLQYFLPYSETLAFEQAFLLDIDAQVQLNLPASLQASSEQLDLSRELTEGGRQLFSAQLEVYSGPRLRFTLQGNPFATSSEDPGILTQEQLLPLLAGIGSAFGAALLALGWRWRRRNEASQSIDKLLAEIARLEGAHDSGAINHDAYHHRRKELKAQLAQLMAAEE